MAKYIVKQYTAAIGGETALSKVESMYAMGKVKMSVTEFSAAKTVMGKRKKKILRLRNVNNNNGGEMGGFVLWKKGFNQWTLELVVSGSKVSAGCDGNITWKQNPCLSSHSSKPSGPLRRFLQGLDPKTTANLFAESVCVGEKSVNGEECFVLRVETESLTFKYTVLGCFSQRSGLLIQLEDIYQVKGKNGIVEGEEEILWETRSESLIEDYKSVEGILIGHSGRTRVSLLKFNECCESNYTKSVMEEDWEIEEVGFNVKGLCSDFFLSPGDLCNKEDEESEFWFGGYNSPMLTLKGSGGNWKVKSSKVIALEDFGEFEGY